MDTRAPLFRAMVTSTRPIYQLLRCVSFANKVHVDISTGGIKFIADHTRVMQGMASLGKSLFTSYTLNTRHDGDGGDEGGDDDDTRFQISLPALLEALQIFGVTDAPGRMIKPDPEGYRGGRGNYSSTYGSVGGGAAGSTGGGPDAFNNQILGMPGMCTLSYAERGNPFGVVLEEASVKTTCNLATYLPEQLEEIPFDRDDLLFKMIMQPRWLLDALVELAPATPNLLTLTVTPRAPYLRLSSQGPLGSSSVDFSRGRHLFESLTVGERWSQSFKFDLIKAATEAMRIASKVSIRGDRQGVLSLQFMVEMDSGNGGANGSNGGAVGGGSGSHAVGGGMQWLQFLFVPFMASEEDEEDEEDTGEGRDGDDDEDDDDEL